MRSDQIKSGEGDQETLGHKLHNISPDSRAKAQTESNILRNKRELMVLALT